MKKRSAKKTLLVRFLWSRLHDKHDDNLPLNALLSPFENSFTEVYDSHVFSESHPHINANTDTTLNPIEQQKNSLHDDILLGPNYEVDSTELLRSLLAHHKKQQGSNKITPGMFEHLLDDTETDIIKSNLHSPCKGCNNNKRTFREPSNIISIVSSSGQESVSPRQKHGDGRENLLEINSPEGDKNKNNTLITTKTTITSFPITTSPLTSVFNPTSINNNNSTPLIMIPDPIITTVNDSIHGQLLNQNPDKNKDMTLKTQILILEAVVAVFIAFAVAFIFQKLLFSIFCASACRPKTNISNGGGNSRSSRKVSGIELSSHAAKTMANLSTYTFTNEKPRFIRTGPENSPSHDVSSIINSISTFKNSLTSNGASSHCTDIHDYPDIDFDAVLTNYRNNQALHEKEALKIIDFIARDRSVTLESKEMDF